MIFSHLFTAKRSRVLEERGTGLVHGEKRHLAPFCHLRDRDRPPVLKRQRCYDVRVGGHTDAVDLDGHVLVQVPHEVPADRDGAVVETARGAERIHLAHRTTGNDAAACRLDRG